MKRLGSLIVLVVVASLCLAAWWPDEHGASHDVKAALWTTFDSANHRTVNKFGRTGLIDTGETETLWDPAGLTSGPAHPPYPADGVPVTLYVSSNSAADGDGTLADVAAEIQGLDADWNFQTATVALNGKAFVEVAGVTWLRVYRVKNVGGTQLVSRIYVHVDDDDTGSDGIPDDLAQIHGLALANHDQSLMAIYTIAANKRGILDQFCFGMSALAGATSREIDVKIQVRPFGGVFQTKWTTGVHNYGNGACFNLKYPLLIGEKSDIRLQAGAASANSTSVYGQFSLIEIPDNWY